MLKPDFQHQLWITKKTVQRKLGAKEDECIVSSDAELDSKIALLKSIAESCTQLQRIIDNYQEKTYILAQEENSVGIFLKESGKCSTTSNKVMCCAGKAISFCGQQHMKMRAPLVRLHHEVETFTGRGIKDTYATVQAMERARTEYRAALGWMKAASAQLDPEKGLDKFRTAQMHVKVSKSKFDTITLDCLQKIDLLAAARCNMFSHVLVAYQAALLEFANKTSYTFKAALKILEEKQHYNFTILKDLTQAPPEKNPQEQTNIAALDFDQMLFFKEEYEDKEPTNEEKPASTINVPKERAKSNKSNDQLIDTTTAAASVDADKLFQSNLDDLLGIFDMNDDASSASDPLLNLFDQSNSLASNSNAKPSTLSNFNFDLFGKLNKSNANKANASDKSAQSAPSKMDKKASAWFDLFADLDPLANPAAMEQRISSANKNYLDA